MRKTVFYWLNGFYALPKISCLYVCESVSGVFILFYWSLCLSTNTTIFIIFIYMCCACLLVSQSCPTLCDPMDCSLPGSSVRGDSPGKNTEVDAMLSSRGSFNPGIEPRSPALQADSLPPSGFLSSSDSKESACIAGDPDSIPGLGRSLGEGNGCPLQYSCLESCMDRGAWQVQPMGLQRVRHAERLTLFTVWATTEAQYWSG